LVAPLTDLTKKGEFRWTGEAHRKLDKMKEVMSTFPVLALPDFTQPFVLECDASSEGIGAIFDATEASDSIREQESHRVRKTLLHL
jgi:hypothetical protein